jgi:hypothetical protein
LVVWDGSQVSGNRQHVKMEILVHFVNFVKFIKFVNFLDFYKFKKVVTVITFVNFENFENFANFVLDPLSGRVDSLITVGPAWGKGEVRVRMWKGTFE